MRDLGHLLLFALVVTAHACSPVSRASPSQGSPLAAMPTPSPRRPASEFTPEISTTSSVYQVFAVVAQDAGEVIVRAGPGIDFLVVTQLKVGEGAPVVDRTPQSDWWKLDLGGTTAWVYAAFVNMVGNPEGVPVVPTPTVTSP